MKKKKKPPMQWQEVITAQLVQVSTHDVMEVMKQSRVRNLKGQHLSSTAQNTSVEQFKVFADQLLIYSLSEETLHGLQMYLLMIIN